MPSKSSDPVRIRQRLLDMLGSINRIQDYTAGMGLAAFLADQKTIDACVRNIEIIGEASRHVPADLAALYTRAPWRVIGDLRNKVIHEYDGIDPARIYQTITDELPDLKSALFRMLDACPDPAAD
ncbi:DUF86 domain-containing protein [Aerophototrophica crusticola]|uniref:DUF86 domain-containing protein n=1 Tax=Aerophototrophica crusticola TaxID=1709002 RepID=A0A858R8M8_9PROT|nr:DUF86 domain-containing protein [Rhodospirillaceae bacterium B3]